MYKLTILPLAKQDIKQAAMWYNSKKKGLGKEFTKEIKNKVTYIKQNPEASAIRFDNTRCTVVGVFPFLIHYTIDKTNNVIAISAVFHTSLDASIWLKR